MTLICDSLAERSKVNLDIWNLFIAIVLGLTYQVKIMTGWTKNTFQKFSNLNVLGSKFDLYVK